MELFNNLMKSSMIGVLFFSAAVFKTSENYRPWQLFESDLVAIEIKPNYLADLIPRQVFTSQFFY